MAVATNHEALVDGIYEAALSPAAWPKVLAGMASAIKGVGTDLYLFNDKQLVFSSIGGIADEALQEYLLVYHGRTERSRALDRVEEGGIICDLDFLSNGEMGREDFYRDFLRRWDIRLFLGGCPLKTPDSMCMFGVHLPADVRSLGEREYAVVQALVPHLRRASLVQLRLGMVESSERRFRDVLDSLALPLVLVRQGGRIVCANAAAEALLARGDPVTATRGILGAIREDENRLLHQAIAAVAGGLEHHRILLSGRSAAAPVSVIACPLARQRRLEDDADVLLVMGGAEHPGEEFTGLARKLYGLTSTEAELAGWLVSGGTLQTWCMQRSTSYETARSQLKTILVKVGASGQPDLLRRLLTGAAALRGRKELSQN